MTSKVGERSDASKHMVECAAKGAALMGGTKAMRAAKTAYLPQFENESDKAYNARLNSSWLFNGYRKTVRDMTGRVFDRPVMLTDDVPEQIRDWAENIDMQGRDLSTFLRDVFEDAMGKAGVSYILVDSPIREATVTQAQAQQQNLRPYFVHLSVEDILGWRAETINNVMTLTQLRIHQTVERQDPKDEFDVVTIEQVRVFDLTGGRVQIRLYEHKLTPNGSASGFDLIETFQTEMEEIKCVPVYINRTEFFAGEPFLDDLADVNIAHWQSQSDQRNILHYARVPMLFMTGVQEDENITLGAATATRATDPNAKMEWVEHSGEAISAGRQDLKDLEFQMEAHGLQLLVGQNALQSATGEALDAAKETSALSMTADQLQDAAEQGIQWMGKFAGLDVPQGSVIVNKEFGVSMMTPQEMQVMLTAVNTGNMSRATFLDEMARRGMIREDIVPEEEIERIEEDSEDLMMVEFDAAE